MNDGRSGPSKLILVGLFILLPVLGLAMLMPALQTARKRAIRSSMEYEDRKWQAPPSAQADEAGAKKQFDRPAAIVQLYEARIDLTPKLSVGTATPESIYVADFAADIEAVAPTDAADGCRIELPLPPKIISLADVSITVDDEPSEDFDLKAKRLVWFGELDKSEPSKIVVRYSATGMGIYTLEKPSGRIIDRFETRLVAHNSNIRMLELSLQPNTVDASGGQTVYEWDYQRLVVARPIAIDVLGIAAVDRLGELTWLGPVSVLVFGILISLAALALDPAKLNGWLAILVVGCFAGAYPLMYFLQDFITLGGAIAVAAGVVILIIGWRIVSLFGLRTGLWAGVLMPGAIMALTVAAGIYTRPAMQGVLLTVLAIFGLVVAMLLLPRAQAKVAKPAQSAPPPMPKEASGEG